MTTDEATPGPAYPPKIRRYCPGAIAAGVAFVAAISLAAYGVAQDTGRERREVLVTSTGDVAADTRSAAAASDLTAHYDLVADPPTKNELRSLLVHSWRLGWNAREAEEPISESQDVERRLSSLELELMSLRNRQDVATNVLLWHIGPERPHGPHGDQ